MKDSNPHKRSQSPVCYHYTNPLRTKIIILQKTEMSTLIFGNLEKFLKGGFGAKKDIFPPRFVILSDAERSRRISRALMQCGVIARPKKRVRFLACAQNDRHGEGTDRKTEKRLLLRCVFTCLDSSPAVPAAARLCRCGRSVRVRCCSW